jgi:hypothetical protein
MYDAVVWKGVMLLMKGNQAGIHKVLTGDCIIMDYYEHGNSDMRKGEVESNIAAK